jgi:hypothetical protein
MLVLSITLINLLMRMDLSLQLLQFFLLMHLRELCLVLMQLCTYAPCWKSIRCFLAGLENSQESTKLAVKERPKG